MLLDRYLVPLTELAISVVLPLVLTLKALQLTREDLIDGDKGNDNDTRPSSPTSSHSQSVLSFWLVYWLIVCFAELAGVNSHVRCLIAVFYYSKSSATQFQLLHFYKNSLLPFTSTMLFRTANVRLNEQEVDKAIGYLLERMCFDPNYFTDSLLEMTIPTATSITTSTPDESIENIIPLEMKRVRSPPPYPTQIPATTSMPPTAATTPGKRSRRHSLSVHGSIGKKPSKQDLRSSSWNVTELVQLDHVASQARDPLDQTPSSTSTSNPSPPRVPSGADLVFDDSTTDRRSLRGSLKGLFT